MNCPNCSSKTIGFLDWCKTRNALWWKCQHCATRLKANGATWKLIGAGLLLFIAMVAGTALVEHGGILSKENSRSVLGVLMLVVFIPYYWLAYKRGGYVVRGS
jgi:hypothetical protein